MKIIVSLSFFLTVLFLSACADKIEERGTEYIYQDQRGRPPLTGAQPDVRPIPNLRIQNVKATPVSRGKVLLTWETNINVNSTIDVRVFDSKTGQIEDTFPNIPYDFPPSQNKSHTKILVHKKDISFDPQKRYDVVIRATSKDGQQSSATTPRFQVSPILKKVLFVQNGPKNIQIFPYGDYSRQIQPAITIANPGEQRLVHTAYDKKRDVLYLTTEDSDSIVIFTNLQKPDSPSETRIVRGVNTKISRPTGIVIDELRNILYVANQKGNTVIAFKKAHLLQGNTSPGLTLKGGKESWISNPTGLALDEKRDVLYVSCAATETPTILTFFPASSSDEHSAPVAKLYGKDSTKIRAPVDLTFDEERKILYILDQQSGILAFQDLKNQDSYKPLHPDILNGRKKPLHIIEDKDWFLRFIPHKYGGLTLDSENDRLYITGKPTAMLPGNELSPDFILAFDNISTLDGKRSPNHKIPLEKNMLMGKGLVYNAGKIFALAENKKKKGFIHAYDVSTIVDGGVKLVKTRRQMSAFAENITGLAFNSKSKGLIALTDNFLEFSSWTLQSAWNYFNADNIIVPKKAEGIENRLAKVRVDGERGIIYAIDKENNSIVAFKREENKTYVEKLPEKTITPNLPLNYEIVDFALDREKDIIYILMKQESSDRSLKVFAFNDASDLDGIVPYDRKIVVTDVPQQDAGNYLLAIDPKLDRLFIGVTKKIAIFSSLSTLNGHEKVTPSKVLEGRRSLIGNPTALHFYQSTPTVGHLFLTNKAFGGSNETGVLVFGPEKLDPNADIVLDPDYKLTGGSHRLFNPLDLAVGNIEIKVDP